MIIEYLNLPEKTYLGKNIPKILFYNNCSITKSQREIFQNMIEKIILMNNLKKETINIRPYEDEEHYYEEILILKIILKEKGKLSQIGEMFNSFIPYPLIIEFKYEEKNWVYLCKKRKSRSVKSEFVIENPVEKEFYGRDLTLLKNENLSFSDFFSYYNSLYNFIIKLKYMEHIGQKEIREETLEISQNKLEEIENLKTEIIQLKNKLSKEKQMNRKADIMKLLKEKTVKLSSLL